MKRASIFASTLLFAGAAAAADQVVYEPVMTGPAWQGVYVGGHVGVGMQTVMESYPGDPYRQDIGGSGFVGGVFVGYNWLVAPQWVLGVEAEANYNDISGIWYGYDDPATRHEWSVAARARAGYLVNPYSLLYGSVGWAYGEWESEYIGFWDDGNYKSDGLQLGFGLETFATDRLSLRLESIFTAYQDKDFNPGTLRVDAETLVVRFGAAYHFGEPTGDAQPLPTYDWTGFYLGAHAGAGMFSFEESYDGSTYTQDIGGHGVLGGAFAGYNWHVSQMFVVGAELEANISGVDGEWYGDDVSEEWNAAARLRAGYLVNPATLLYASVGYAYGSYEIPQEFVCCGGTDPVPTETESLDGVQLGLGIETRLSERISVRAEGLYTFFGEETFDIPGTSGDTNFDFDTLTGRIGVAFHF